MDSMTVKTVYHTYSTLKVANITVIAIATYNDVT